ncbi:hypothetical protein ACJJTC_008943 [Scirpophaga incertulas]
MDVAKRFKDLNLNILKTIGQGTYGNVYLCENGKNQALQIVKDIEYKGRIQDNGQDIANEVKILSSLKHPNIIEFYECCNVNNHVMIIMEYAASGNLAEYMYQRYPKLIEQQKTSTVIGTPFYLAPELCEGELYDTKSDIWALGCLLYEMCTHRRAFDAETLVGLVKVITQGSVHPIDLNIYERGMQDLIDAMLSILPDKRPSVKELMGRMILLPVIYDVFLDAGNDDLLLLKAKNFINM